MLPHQRGTPELPSSSRTTGPTSYVLPEHGDGEREIRRETVPHPLSKASEARRSVDDHGVAYADRFTKHSTARVETGPKPFGTSPPVITRRFRERNSCDAPSGSTAPHRTSARPGARGTPSRSARKGVSLQSRNANGDSIERPVPRYFRTTRDRIDRRAVAHAGLTTNVADHHRRFSSFEAVRRRAVGARSAFPAVGSDPLP